MCVDGFIDGKSGLRLGDLKIEDDLKKTRYDGKSCPPEYVLPPFLIPVYQAGQGFQAIP